ncbi:MAG: glycosyltransferase family 4 protein [Armatimonadota bacterium]
MKAIYHHRTQGRDVEAVHIHGICSGLAELGYEVEIVSPPGVTADPNAPVSAASTKKAGPWSALARRAPQLLFELLELGYNAVALPRLLRRCRAERPALLCERYALYNFSGVLAGKLTGTPVVLEVNETAGVDRTRQGKRLVLPRLAEWFERRIFAGAAGFVVVSGYLKDHLAAKGVDPRKIRVTPNAVHSSWLENPADGRRLREQYGFEGCTVVGFAGSFTKWHGVDLLVRAFAALAADRPELRLLLVGDGARRAHAEAEVAELGLSDRVVFTGRVPHSRMAEHVAAIDIGVMPASNVYGSPMKVFEYMALGKPPVAPRYRPLEEALQHEAEGLLFDPEDPDGLRAALARLVDDPALRARLGAAARARVSEQHRWVHNARVVESLALGADRPATTPAVAEAQQA